VAQLAARYDLLAIPVSGMRTGWWASSPSNDIIGIVKEGTEDFYKMVGTRRRLLYQEQPLEWRASACRDDGQPRRPVTSGFLLKHFQVTLREALFLSLCRW
jgi:hypothetical protein